MKKLKFSSDLISKILSGEKTSTWRLFDDKNLIKGDELVFIDKTTRKEFGTAHIISVKITTLGALTAADWDGHEKFASSEEMYATYRSYYGSNVDENSEVKILTFKFQK